MPIDKFGRHLHQHRQHPFSAEDASKLYLVQDGSSLQSAIKEDIAALNSSVTEKISTLSYSIPFYVSALNTDDSGTYRLIHSNGSKYVYKYKLPTAVITHVSYIPYDAKLYINDVERSKSELIGTKLNTGDLIRVTYKPKKSLVFACEFILEIPMFPNA